MFASRFGFLLWLLSPTTEGIGMQIGPPVWTGECGLPRKTCIGDLPIVIENRRTDRVVVVTGLDLLQVWYGWRRKRSFPVAPATVGPGAAIRHTLAGIKDTEQTLAVRVWLRFGSGNLGQVTSGPFVLSNPSREAAKRACARDRGDWRTSMSGYPFCVPRAPDAGKTCRDGNACQGVCLFDRDEPVGPPEGPFRRQRWRPVGHCSEFRSVASCYQYIERGSSNELPRYMHTAAPLVCVD